MLMTHFKKFNRRSGTSIEGVDVILKKILFLSSKKIIQPQLLNKISNCPSLSALSGVHFGDVIYVLTEWVVPKPR